MSKQSSLSPSSPPPPPFETDCLKDMKSWFNILESIVDFVSHSSNLLTTLRNSKNTLIMDKDSLELPSVTNTDDIKDLPSENHDQEKTLKIQSLVPYQMVDTSLAEPNMVPRSVMIIDTNDTGDNDDDVANRTVVTEKMEQNNTRIKDKTSNDSSNQYFNEFTDSDQTMNSLNLQESFESHKNSELTEKQKIQSELQSSTSKCLKCLEKESRKTFSDNLDTNLSKDHHIIIAKSTEVISNQQSSISKRLSSHHSVKTESKFGLLIEKLRNSQHTSIPKLNVEKIKNPEQDPTITSNESPEKVTNITNPSSSISHLPLRIGSHQSIKSIKKGNSLIGLPNNTATIELRSSMKQLVMSDNIKTDQSDVIGKSSISNDDVTDNKALNEQPDVIVTQSAVQQRDIKSFDKLICDICPIELQNTININKITTLHVEPYTTRKKLADNSTVATKRPKYYSAKPIKQQQQQQHQQKQIVLKQQVNENKKKFSKPSTASSTLSSSVPYRTSQAFSKKTELSIRKAEERIRTANTKRLMENNQLEISNKKSANEKLLIKLRKNEDIVSINSSSNNQSNKIGLNRRPTTSTSLNVKSVGPVEKCKKIDKLLKHTDIEMVVNSTKKLQKKKMMMGKSQNSSAIFKK